MSAKRMNGLHLHKSGFFFAAVLLMLSILLYQCNLNAILLEINIGIHIQPLNSSD